MITPAAISMLQAGQIIASGAATLALEGDSYIMRKGEARHELAVFCTDAARLDAHWASFAAIEPPVNLEAKMARPKRARRPAVIRTYLVRVEMHNPQFRKHYVLGSYDIEIDARSAKEAMKTARTDRRDREGWTTVRELPADYSARRLD
jgi:hypothetical protein